MRHNVKAELTRKLNIVMRFRIKQNNHKLYQMRVRNSKLMCASRVVCTKSWNPRNSAPASPTLEWEMLI